MTRLRKRERRDIVIVYESAFQGLAAVGLDGEVGKVHSFLFDDRDWGVRHIAVRTGSRLRGRIAVIPPGAVTIPSRHLDRLSVSLKRDELRQCPDLDETKPVSLQEETRLRNQRAVIGCPYDGFAAAFMVPTATAQRELAQVSEVAVAGSDPHLRSTRGVRQYRVRLQTGESIGHVDDFVIDSEQWRITHLVVCVQGWPRHRRLVIPSSAVKEISWFDQEITTRLHPLGMKEKKRTGSGRRRPHARRAGRSHPHARRKARK
jgi:sporulation protein YlmC with PRC-barrel domain